jgi:membrane protein
VLAEVFDIEQERGIIEGKLFDIRITIVATLLFAANTIVTAYLSLARSRGFDLLVAFGITREALGGVEYLVGRLLAWAFLVAMFFGLYKFLPVRKVRWQAAAMAALFTSVLLELAKVVFAWIVRSFNPGSMYTGTLAAIVIVVVWVYYAAIIFILGGEVGQVYDLRHVRRLRREVFTH